MKQKNILSPKTIHSFAYFLHVSFNSLAETVYFFVSLLCTTSIQRELCLHQNSNIDGVGVWANYVEQRDMQKCSIIISDQSVLGVMNGLCMIFLHYFSPFLDQRPFMHFTV